MRVRTTGIAMLVAAGLMASLPAAASDVGYRTFAKSGTFEDVSDNLKDAIIKRGYVIDYIGQFNAMLQRTAKETETVSGTGSTSPYRNAHFVQFCPAKLTHEAVNASPLAIANCPIAFFVYELAYEPGKVQVGYRLPVPSPSKRVNEINDRIMRLMQEIAEEATR